jgi:NADH-quinone oxidoreductase subunit M
MESFPGNLSLLLFLPLVGALLLLWIPRRNSQILFQTALLFTSITFLWSLKILWEFAPASAEMQFQERLSWIPAYGIDYFIGIDGISLFLVLLTTFLGPIVILASWTVTERVKEYLFFMLTLQTGMIGVFLALDLFLFYVFWEVMLVPMYFLIGVWGGPRRIYAALKFVLYTMSGSLLMLIAIIYLAWRNYQVTQTFVEAPTAGSVVLAGILLKMGTYGFLRFAIPLFPDATLAAAPYIIALSVIGIVYGALVAMMQADLKKLVAYSSVSHLGFVMLGLFALNLHGIQGGVYHMINHGLSTGALFLLVGMIYDRRHTRMIEDFGGLWKQLPIFSAIFLVVTLSSIGLPGLNGFVGEFLILLGAFGVTPLWTAGAASGIVLGAIYMLWMFRRVVLGPLSRPENQKLEDIGARDIVILAPIVALIIFMGIYPQPFLSRIKPAVDPIVQRVENRKEIAFRIQNPGERLRGGREF